MSQSIDLTLKYTTNTHLTIMDIEFNTTGPTTVLSSSAKQSIIEPQPNHNAVAGEFRKDY